MMDLKVLGSALHQLEDERGVPKEKIIEAIEQALAAAYKRDYGKKGQIVRASFDLASGKTEFSQVKIVVDESMLRPETEGEGDAPPEPPRAEGTAGENGEKESLVRFNPEQHIMLEDARKIRKDAAPGEELVFPLEARDDFGRIAAQTAKQVIIQRIREAEKVSVLNEYGKKQGEIVTGTVQRMERGSIFIDLGKAAGILSYHEQIPGERYKQGERVRAYLYAVDETPRGIDLHLSRSHPKFIQKLFEVEAPEIAGGVVEIKAIAREAGSRSKIAVASQDPHVDPVGACVGQRGVRVSTVMSELGGEKIDIIEWSAEPARFIEDALSPAKVEAVVLDEESRTATITVSDDQLSLAIGRGGQNVRLAAKLTGWKIDIKGVGGAVGGEANEEGAGTQPAKPETPPSGEIVAEEKKGEHASEASGEEESSKSPKA